MSSSDYLRALFAGEPVDTPTQVVQGSMARWKRFNDEVHPDLPGAVKTLRRWYNDGLAAGEGILIAGGFGCGKTHLAKAIYEMRGPGVVFFEELKLVKAIQETYGRQSRETENAYFRRAARARLLIFDDLGAYETENMAWMQNIYRGLFDDLDDGRRAILITTNLSLADRKGAVSEMEERVGGRNFTRIMGAVGSSENYINLFDVPDYRLRGFK